MSYLSVRKIPREVERAILREARARGVTKTEIVVEALEEKFHVGENRKKRNLRQFFGKMTPREFKEFQEITSDFEKIDEALWS